MKTKILYALENHRGEFISGEDLAASFGVSRAAVWKAVEHLRKEGHKITAITNKGYCLEKFSDTGTTGLPASKDFLKSLHTDSNIHLSSLWMRRYSSSTGINSLGKSCP